jgi:diacylglycerol kinase (ATP)
MTVVGASLDLTDRDRRPVVGEAPESKSARYSNFRSAALVVAVRSRADKIAAATALRHLRRLGVPVGIHAVEDPARLVETVRGLLSEGHDLILLGGDNSLISSVAGIMARSDATLGLLPLWSTGDLARSLGMPPELEEACDAIAGGMVREVVLGLAGDDYFVDAVSVRPNTGTARSPGLERAVGSLTSAEYESFAAALAFPGGDHEPVAIDGLVQVTVNTHCLEHDPGSQAVALDVYAVEADCPQDVARVTRSLEIGDYVNNRSVHHWRTPRVLLATDPPLPLYDDGNPAFRTPMPFSASPGALKVLVPSRVSGDINT